MNPEQDKSPGPFPPRLQELRRETVRLRKRIRALATEAGRAVMEIYHTDFDVDLKGDDSPVTLADRMAHEIIRSGLQGLSGPLGELPVLSEEGGIADYGIRSTWTAWWLVDPLDGTREFVKRNGEFTVNIALIVRPDGDGTGEPAAGWVFVPVTDVLYEGIVGYGARRITGIGGSTVPVETELPDPALRNAPAGAAVPSGSSRERLVGVSARRASSNGREVPVPFELSTPNQARSCRIVASRSHRTAETDLVIDAIRAIRGAVEIVSSGSSLKFCRIAEGSADIYPRPGPTMEWDTAAADAVCRASGVRVIDTTNGSNLVYGKEDLHNPWFLVSRDNQLIGIALEALR